MANDSSLSSALVLFDFDTQSGITHLLASVRASDISVDEKNELRDLIFLYSNGGRDQSVRNNLEQKITQFKLAALPKTVSSVPQKIHEFGTSRPSPAFKVIPVQKTAVTTKVEPVVSPTPTQQPIVETVPVKTSEPVVDIVSTEVPVEPIAPENSTVEDSLARIKEIKAIVNDKVGNPVNLVDIDNEVGREYMASLLDAMRKVNSGSSASSAMQRLESALVRVEEALKNQVKTTDAPSSAPTVAEKTPVVVSSVPDNLPSQPVATPEPVAVTTAPAPSAVESNQPKFSPVSTLDMAADELRKADTRPVVQVAQSESLLKPSASVAPQKVNIEAPVQVSPVTTNTKEVEQTSVSTWGSDNSTAVPEKNVRQVAVPSKYESASLAESETKLRTLEDLPTAAAMETSSVLGDPLFTKQVDDGLDQLLSDWMLFKKSGLFGTGPKGASHPLYIKIKDLQIPLLLAGRFEGATQEVKQSITDYMNGWRYEQGIVYDQGETFDHYLRRVIRHILDLQKKA
jgi:hypothetical protein